MRRSKRIETLDQRPVNLDGYINEWPEMGFVAMTSPYDPKPSVKVANGRIVELDGKKREDFDFIDQFIADYAMNVERAEASMAVSSLEIAHDRGYSCVQKRDSGACDRNHACKDDRGYESSECRRADDGNAEDPCEKNTGKSGAHHKSER